MSKKEKKLTKKQSEEKKDLRVEILDQVAKLTTAGFGLVAALAWNEAIKSIFNQFFPSPGNNVIALTLYALLITIIVVVVTIQLGKAVNLAKKRVSKK